MSTIKVNALRHTGGSSDNINLDSSARVLIGTSSAVTAPDDLVQINTSSGVSIHRGENGAAGPRLDLQKSRNATYGSNTVVQSGDLLGSIFFRGDDGTDYNTAGAQIFAAVDGTPGSNDMPGRLSFSTTADGASSPTEAMRIDSSQNLRFNSGFGSVATAYGCRAWVNFNGTGSVAIRGSGNVSSITDNGGGGDYNVNFTTAMPDTNYATVYGFGINGTSTAVRLDGTYSTTSVHVQATNSVSGAGADTAISCIAVFR